MKAPRPPPTLRLSGRIPSPPHPMGCRSRVARGERASRALTSERETEESAKGCGAAPMSLTDYNFTGREERSLVAACVVQLSLCVCVCGFTLARNTHNDTAREVVMAMAARGRRLLERGDDGHKASKCCQSKKGTWRVV